MAVSLAYKIISALSTTREMSLIRILKSKGPKIDPYGTPWVICSGDDLTLSNITVWLRLNR